MVFVLDESLERLDERAKGALAKLLVAIVEKLHYVKSTPEVWQWIESEVLTTQFLGLMDINLIRKNNEFRDVKGMMLRHLSQIRVGCGEGCIDPGRAIGLVDKPSYVVVENEANDWPVLRHWIELMKNERAFKSINSLVEKKKTAGDIRPYNAGSGGQIINTLSGRVAEFAEWGKYKVMAVYDSDKESEDAQLGNEKKKIQEYASRNELMNHVLFKREMENYFSLECYRKARLADNELVYPYSVQSWDFEDVENYIRRNSTKHYRKQDLPKLNNYIDKHELKSITEHHTLVHDGMRISEVQSLILKFARLV